MKKLLIICLTILLIIPLIGCWDRLEINDVAIVMGTSYDKVDDKTYKAGIVLPLPGEMGGAGSSGGGGGTSGGASYYVDAAKGRNIREAIENIQKHMSRRIAVGHRRVAVFSEDLARSGLGETLDVLTRTRESRLTTQVFVSEGDALNVIATNPQLESISAESIREIGKNAFDTMLREFLTDYQQDGNDPILPVITLIENESPDSELVSKQIEMSKLAIFKDDKMIIKTNEKQTSGVDWIFEKKNGKTFTFEMKEGEHISIQIIKDVCDISYTLKNDLPVFYFKVNIGGVILENETDLNLKEQSVFQEINEKVAETVKQEVEDILDTTLSEGIDSFGLGRFMHRKERKKWNIWKSNWRELLPTLTYEVDVSSSVELPGLVTEGIGIRE
ncbi:Ger(x)C family spore germination protein [Evansella sp. AB-rgal1]|uniref:Ger(x)C family spore germination protein n=1 Tax=Evansella sp. AB-rgal1 TaxID=3242696 RepID=UPI00359E5203